MVETITKAEFELLLQGERGEYYQGRWEYFKHVVDLISICQPNKVLELGPGSKTIVKYSDIMVLPEEDAWGRPDKEVGNIYQHDAREKTMANK